MLTPQQVAQFNADGFLRGPKVLTDAQVEELRAELERVMQNKDNPDSPQPVSLSNWNPKNPVWQIVNIWEASDAFRRLLSNQMVVQEIAQLTSPKQLRVWHDQIQYKPATDGGVNMWHQDSPYWPALGPKTEQVTAWIALDDVDADNGCMSMVPGSHKWGVKVDFLHTLKDFKAMPAEFEGHKLEVRLAPVKKGEVHFHHGLTWHGSHANTSGRPRRAIAVHFMTEKTYHDSKGKHLMTPFIEVADGKMIEGDHFPMVYDAGKIVPAAVPAKKAAVA